MSLHKLSAGHGYDYLIRQVAALDATHRAVKRGSGTAAAIVRAAGVAKCLAGDAECSILQA
jgi:hypothetical protein